MKIVVQVRLFPDVVQQTALRGTLDTAGCGQHRSAATARRDQLRRGAHGD
ncbi:hypothetical protein [Dactylosporangium sp. CA-233914]